MQYISVSKDKTICFWIWETGV